MKNFTLLLASAAVVSSAWASEPLAVRQFTNVPASLTEKVSTAVLAPEYGLIPQANRMAKAPRFRAGEAGTETPAGMPSAFYLTPTYEGLFTGLTPELGGYKASVRVAGVYGSCDFRNLSTDATSYSWSYDNLLAEDETITSFEQDLIIPANISKVYSMPTLTAVSEAGTSTYTVEDLSLVMHYFGGSLASIGQDKAGLTPYPYCGDNDFGFSSTIYFNYDKTGTDSWYDANGVCTEWTSILSDPKTNLTATNVKMESIASILPKQTSPYMISKLFNWFRYTATEDTELTCFLYEVTKDGIAEKPFAKGSATLAAGSDVSGCPVFSLVAVDEQGDEVEADVIVTTKVLVEFEFADNEAITKLCPIIGTGSELPREYSQYTSVFFPTCALIQLSADYNDGTSDTSYYSFPGFYSGSTDDTLWYPAYFITCVDAVFTYVIDEQGEVCTVFEVAVPNEGGEVSVKAQPYYGPLDTLVEEGYMTAETEADWFTFELSEADPDTGFTTITIDANSLEGTESREGVIAFSGMAQDFTVVVRQGAAASLDQIAAGANAASKQYYDLQGRRLSAAPANGLYLERQGNTVTKILK